MSASKSWRHEFLGGPPDANQKYTNWIIQNFEFLNFFGNDDKYAIFTQSFVIFVDLLISLRLHQITKFTHISLLLYIDKTNVNC